MNLHAAEWTPAVTLTCGYRRETFSKGISGGTELQYYSYSLEFKCMPLMLWTVLKILSYHQIAMPFL
jgi:hypothetical protein